MSTAPIEGSAPPPPRSRWTLMLYCDCDNDLEEATLRNLQEISKVGSSPDVAMVALVDRSQRKRAKKPTLEEGYSDAPLQNLAPWSNAKLLKIEDLIEAGTSTDDAEKSKPHPDIFEAAMEKLGKISPKKCLTIGDTPYDAEAAGKAKIKTVGVLCGGFPEADLKKAGAVAIFRDPEDLLRRYEESPFAED